MQFLTETILAWSLTVPCAPQEAPSMPPLVTRHVTLQVRTEPDYAATDVAHLLSTDGFLGSVARNMVPTSIDQTVADRIAASDPNHVPLVYVSTDGPISEILSVSFTSSSVEAIEDAREALLTKLGQIEPTSQARRKIERAAVLEADANARRRLLELRSQFNDFVEKFGADPNAELASVRGERLSLGKRLGELERDIALRTATSDYLKSWIDRARETAARPVDSTDGLSRDMTTLLEDLRSAEAVVADLGKRMTKDHPEYVKAKRTVEALKSQVLRKDQEANVTVAESRLFGTEEDLFAFSREREWTAARVQQLDQRERELAKLAVTFQDLDSAIRRATQALEIAASQKEVSDRDTPRDGETPWIRILAK